MNRIAEEINIKQFVLAKNVRTTYHWDGSTHPKSCALKEKNIS